MTRYAGTMVVPVGNGFRRRPKVLVVVITGAARSSLAISGSGFEELDKRVITELYSVTDCYPELLASDVDYNYTPYMKTGRKGAGVGGAGSSNMFVALKIMAVGSDL